MKTIIATFALSFVLAGTCLGQIPPPIPFTTISCDSRVKGLHYDATATPDCQAVLFTFTVAVPTGATVSSVKWLVDSQLLSYGTPNTSFVYKAVGVGKHVVAVQLFTNKGTFFGSLTFAAIGGPLDYDVAGGESSLTGNLAVPEHDYNDSVKPFHIQYFGFPASGPKPEHAQAPQYGLVLTYPGQLTGTTFTWTISGPATAWQGTGEPTVNNCNLNATSGSTEGGIKVRVTYNYTDPTDPALTGSAADDSEETPPPNQTEAYPAYYSFTSHRPTSVQKAGNQQPASHVTGSTTAPPPDPTAWTYQDTFEHILYDQNGVQQPSVWVTERFPDATAQLAAWNAATGQSIGLSDAGSAGWHWTTYNGTNWSFCGMFDYSDKIGLEDICGVAGHWDPTQYPALVLQQQFFAATDSTDAGAFGLLVKTWTNTMTVTGVSHE